MKIKLTIVINPPPPVPAAQPAPVAPPIRMTRHPGMVYVECDSCAWENGYDNPTAAKQGLAAHRAWCKKGHGRKANLFG